MTECAWCGAEIDPGERVYRHCCRGHRDAATAAVKALRDQYDGEWRPVMTDRTMDCGAIGQLMRESADALENCGWRGLADELRSAAKKVLAMECRSVALSVPDVERIVAWASLWRGYHDPHWSPDDDELFSRLQCIAFGLTEEKSVGPGGGEAEAPD